MSCFHGNQDIGPPAEKIRHFPKHNNWESENNLRFKKSLIFIKISLRSIARR
jgi:hypothetical protein